MIQPRNYRIAIMYSKPIQDCHDVVIFHPTEGEIKAYWFGYNDFSEVLQNAESEFFLIDEQSFITYIGIDKGLSDRVSDSKLQLIDGKPEQGRFYLYRPDVDMIWGI